MGGSNSTLSSRDFNSIQTIGSGQFSEVKLVTDSATPPNKYAMKIVEQVDDNSLNEVQILKELQSEDRDSKFITKILWDFQEENKLFIVLEYVPGKFFKLLRHASLGGNFKEETAKFYSMQVILALEYVHSRHIVHGDLKPENILLGTNGYLKLSDFGSARHIEDRSTIPCHGYQGTLEYVAPEIFEGFGYNEGVDWWALGVLIYEMLSGRAPFTGQSDTSTKMNIQHYGMGHQPGFSQSAISLIERLLIKNFRERLNNLRNLFAPVTKDPWFNVENPYPWVSIRFQLGKLPSQVDSIIHKNFNTLC